jgi:hypothetical protein
MALWRIRATVDDRPGFLSVLTASLALRSVNILSVQVHATEEGAVDDFLVDAPDRLTADDLIEACERGRGRDPWVTRSDARGLADEPTRVLALAAKVAGDPDALGDALVALLGECEITWRPAPVSAAGAEPVPAGDVAATTNDLADLVGAQRLTANVLHLTDPAGGTLVVHRAEPAFTPAEFARAQALAELAAIGFTRACPSEAAAG